MCEARPELYWRSDLLETDPLKPGSCTACGLQQSTSNAPFPMSGSKARKLTCAPTSRRRGLELRELIQHHRIGAHGKDGPRPSSARPTCFQPGCRADAHASYHWLLVAVQLPQAVRQTRLDVSSYGMRADSERRRLWPDILSDASPTGVSGRLHDARKAKRTSTARASRKCVDAQPVGTKHGRMSIAEHRDGALAAVWIAGLSQLAHCAMRPFRQFRHRATAVRIPCGSRVLVRATDTSTGALHWRRAGRIAMAGTNSTTGQGHDGQPVPFWESLGDAACSVGKARV